MPDDPETQLRRVVPDDPETQLRRVAADMQSRFTVSTLTVWLQQRLGQQLGTLTSSGDFGQICLDVVQKAEEQKWLDRLLMSLILAAPNRESALQALLSAVDSFAKVDLIRNLQEAFPRVCRIKLWTPEGDVHGTGFLVGPDLVLTNYHVAQPLIERPEDVEPDDMVIQFDAVEPNAESADIVHCRLHPEGWHVDSSRYHALDDQPDDPGDSYEVPDHTEFADHLDYALLRLEKTVGSTVSRLFNRERGWYSLPEKRSASPIRRRSSSCSIRREIRSA
ncbi:trypsin-like peptidase domain-containing protein [Azospirillum sp. B21]|uniref:trypsin-like peptidase domain-containing protein n=1 Tax=Azospirillum sp. B21 TaxID=2607496 RepID=UPI0011EECDF4|nr:trypsin-like peptidase domain-containing protein [Azospirillum sp. B21]KAA0574338.1 trypsin-like peptidase domain-containing protein [Azospirillum sp. B21]